MVQVANLWGDNWSDSLQYGYIPYAKQKQERNWKEFAGKYQRFLMEHGNSNDLQANYFQNNAKIYWTDKMKLETVGKMNDLRTRYASIVERLVPLLTSFLTFEDSLNDHTTEHKFIEKTRSSPSNIEKTRSTDRRRAPKFPILSLPFLNITSNLGMLVLANLPILLLI